ncbi:helicase-associated domain-containing protein [Herbiconiux daphne]|uniref:Helicase-associated domain-containing protein n=1 Tax=Herbiconiux daphne TaxID=2970914 RepID=A0ABT2H069_9MICO|nr:helicase-associated domain-containing protein [Herbiconiux daphne]MCS5732731.1 helicase-associated domain-containing protein [Herbiconiux daphne]
MSDSLTLARRLSALDDDALTALLVTRQVATREVRDFFDLADALLDPVSVRLALRSLDRATIEALAEGSTPADPTPMVELGLAHAVPDAPGGIRAYAAVEDAAAAVLARADSDADAPGAPASTDADADADAEPIDPAGPAGPAAERPAGGVPIPSATAPSDRALASERAFTALTAISELGQQLRSAPVRIRARGGVSATDDKRLAALLGVEPAVVTDLIDIAVAAGLVAVEADNLLSTTTADAWSLLPSGERWLELARAWLHALPEPVQRVLAAGAPDWSGGSRLRTSFAAKFPAADPAMRAALGHVDTVGELLGLAVDGRSTVFGRAVLAGPSDTAEAASAVEAELPPEVDQVYLQHDLSVIAPGPLVPSVDARLRLLADIETRGVASAYRISQQSIDRALASGETELSLREFLARTSLTGLPQAVDYLIGEGRRRHGLVRVRRLDGATSSGAIAPGQATGDPDTGGDHARPDHDPHTNHTRPDPAASPFSPDTTSFGARTEIRTADDTLLRAIAIDQALNPLGLRRDREGALSTRVDYAAVYWMLVDARYPVLAEDASGDELVMRRARVLPSRPVVDDAPVPAAIADLVLRLRASSAQSAPDDASAWIGRQLDKAVRTRTPVTVDVRMPDGSTTHLEVTPLSLSNGRLRCVDVRAGVERTVPVANILQVTTN